MRVVFVCQGMGEYAQAESVASFFKKRGIKTFFIAASKKIANLARNEGFKSFFSPKTQKTHQLIRKLKPNVVFLDNSKTVYMYPQSIMKYPPKTNEKFFYCSLDSNWLFHPKTNYPPFPWLNRVYLTMPEKIFRLGLQKYGGHYQIDEIWSKKIFCPGFIPKGEKFNKKEIKKLRKTLRIQSKEKAIFFYLGIQEERLFSQFTPRLIKALENLQKRGVCAKVFYKGNKKHSCLIHLPKSLTSFEFNAFMAMADLIIQHHGWGTLTKVLHQNVPLLSLAPVPSKKLPFYTHREYYEIEPLQKLGLCKIVSPQIRISQLEKLILSLALETSQRKKMKSLQKKYFEAGEKNLLSDLLIQYKKQK